MNTDNQLLAEYAQKGSEGAFRELVQRHINMVHAAALREAGGNVALAEDITQEVFTELARRATKLSSHPSLAGWLYTCVRQMTANFRRAEHRRQRREQETYLMNELLGPNPDNQLWQKVRPVLDDVMHELNHEDRTAVVLRFFEGLSLKEVGVALGLTENAARMRVERSLEKLHTRLSRRGIHSTASTLAAALVAGCVLSASSAAFASSVATGAMAAASGHAGTFGLTKVLSLAKSKVMVIGSAVVLVSAFILWKHFAAQSSSANLKTQATTVPAAISQLAEIPTPEKLAVAAVAPSNAVPQMAFQLLDAESGEPLVGAKLYMFYMYADGRGKVFHDWTDTKGRWQIDAPQAPFRALNLFVTADGHVPKVTSFGFRRDMPSEYTMKLERGVRIGGVVVDENGRAVAKASIQFSVRGNDPSLAENIQFGPDTTVLTDANGQWSCNMVPEDYETISLQAKDGEHAETNLTIYPASADANKLVIRLPPGFSIKGLVTDLSGNPIANAKVRQVRLNDESEISKKTDASGAFEFKAMAAGEIMLAVQAEGFAPAVQTLELSGNLADLKFQLGPGQILRGRVVDESGNPVANAFIETTRRGINKVKWSANADTDGRFEWNSAPTEPLLYSVLAEGFNRAYAQTLQANGTEQVIKLTREQTEKDDVHITGSVVDADTGAPLDAFKVYVGETAPEWSYPLDFYTTGKAGQFAVSLPVKSGHPGYVIQIEQDGYLPAASPNFQKTNGNQKLEFKMQKGSGPSGVALLPNGEPAANAAVYLCTPRSGVTMDGPAHVQKGLNTTTYQAQTDGSGKFAMAAATDPQGLIIIHDQGFAQISPAALPTGGNITLQPWGIIKGRLLRGSQPAANETVAIHNQVIRYTDEGRNFGFLSFNLETTTDADGNFLFDKVPPGKCAVYHVQSTPSSTSFSSDNTAVTVTAGAVSEVLLGETGRVIVGKAMLAAGADSVNWAKVPVWLQAKASDELTARPKREDFPTLEAFAAASDRFFHTYQYQKRFEVLCESDGSFRLLDVPAGTYELKIEIRDSKKNSVAPDQITAPSPVLDSVTREVVVPDDKNTEPMELGAVELMPQQTNVSAR